MLVTVDNSVSSGLVTVKLVVSYVLVTCWLVVTWPPDEGCATTSDPETQQILQKYFFNHAYGRHWIFLWWVTTDQN